MMMADQTKSNEFIYSLTRGSHASPVSAMKWKWKETESKCSVSAETSELDMRRKI